MSAQIDVVAVMDADIDSRESTLAYLESLQGEAARPICARISRERIAVAKEARDAVAELIEGPLSTKARLEHLLSSLQFDEKLHGNKPERSTLDFPHAIRIVEQAIAALARVRGGAGQ